MNPVEIAVGDKFGRLTVVGKVASNKWGGRMFCCECSCDKRTRTNVLARYLKTGKTKSCGCRVRENMARIGVQRRKLPGESGLNVLYQRYKKQAAKRGLEFAITKSEFMAITSSSCTYCGKAPELLSCNTVRTSTHGNYIYNSVDRSDNSKGYTCENVVPACKNCQFGKRDMSSTDFLAWIKSVAIHTGI